MADTTNFVPSVFANEMQLRTRKARNFDAIEAELPDPRSAPFQLPPVSANIGGWLTKLGNLNPFGKAVSGRDTVWLLDNTAFKGANGDQWEAEFVAAVFEQDPKCKVVDVVTSLAKTLGLADDAEEKKTIEERLMPFLWDIQVARIVKADHKGKELKLGPTSVNGITTNTLQVSEDEEGSRVQSKAKVPNGVKGILEMQTHYAGEEGWSVISGNARPVRQLPTD